MRISGRLLLGLIGLIFIISCGATSNRNAADNIQPQLSVQKLRTAHIIIKFRDDAIDPSRTDFVQGLAHDANAALVYVRPMSGGAHVFRVVNVSDTTQLTEVIQRLSKRPDVLYVEQDRIMRHQQGK